MSPKPKKGQPPPVDKLLKPAIGIAIAMLAYQFFKGITAEIPRVNVEDEIEVREVFFGEAGTGKSYVVLCHAEESKIPISSVFQDAYNDGTAPAEFRIMDCNYTLPTSGKTVAERFKLDVKKRPTIFLSGTVGEPKQIPTKHLKTGAMLVKALKAKLEPHAVKIETTQDLRSKCLDKEICALLLKGSKTAPAYLKDAMSKLLVEFPKVSFAAMDATVLYAKNLEEFLPELADQQPRFVVFRKVSGSLDPKGERLITSIAPLQSNGVSYGVMSNLVGDVISKKAKMEKLPALPKIVTRTKKIEQEDHAKRERKKNRQKEEKPKSTPGGMFHDNDGSAEGRRAERERRRAEHRKQNNVKEKTPEEIAEMERQRRQRMEEASKMWNVHPEDLPPEGEPIDGEEKMEDIMDGDDGSYVEDVHDDDDDDEDVIDLD